MTTKEGFSRHTIALFYDKDYQHASRRRGATPKNFFDAKKKATEVALFF